MTSKRTQIYLRTALTEVELKVLRAIRDYIQARQVSPTYEEVAARTGNTKSAIRHTIARLLRKEMITRAPGRFRNLVVTDLGRAVASRVRK